MKAVLQSLDLLGCWSTALPVKARSSAIIMVAAADGHVMKSRYTCNACVRPMMGRCSHPMHVPSTPAESESEKADVGTSDHCLLNRSVAGRTMPIGSASAAMLERTCEQSRMGQLPMTACSACVSALRMHILAWQGNLYNSNGIHTLARPQILYP